MVGPDRLVNTVAAFDQHGPDLIVVDFGTATTWDVVTPKGEMAYSFNSAGMYRGKADANADAEADALGDSAA